MNSIHNNRRIGLKTPAPATLLCILIAASAVAIGDAGAARGGGGGSRGGGRMAQSSVAGANRSASRPSGGAANSGNRANTGNVNSGNRANSGNVNSGNRANTGNVNNGNNVNTGNVNTGNRVNTGDINTGNVNLGNDVNIDIDGGYGYRGGYYHHPIAAGVAIGAVAVTTAAVMGSYYRTLPPSCTVVVKTGVSYHYCGSVYYQQTWSGNDVVYVVVAPK